MKSAARVFRWMMLAAMVMAALGPAPAARADDTPAPETVVIPGTLQSELGCSGDWQPDCINTALTYDAEDDVWQGIFTVQPNDDQDKKGPRYKAALNGSWGENYGKNAARNGADIPLVVTQTTSVKFYYDHKTHWVTDNFNTPIVVAMGDFQTRLGCTKDDDPGCLRSWLQDPDGDGTYSFVTTQLPAGTYTVELGINEAVASLTGDLQQFMVENDGDEIYFGYTPTAKEFLVSTEGAPKGNLARLRAYWVSRDTILWNVVGSPKYTYALHYSPEAALALDATGITGGAEIPLVYSKSGPGGDLLKKFPHLGGYTALKLNPDDLPTLRVPDMLKGQVAVTVRDASGKMVDAAGVQIPGVLDDLYTYTGPLGATFENGAPTVRVWAPTAKSVTLRLYADSQITTGTAIPMAWDAGAGVWSAAGAPDWKNKYYLYEVEVYVPSTGKIEKNLVTDPYSFSLSMNSVRSQIVDLNDPALKPDGWDDAQKPALDAPEEAVIYELHVRDFSIHDATVPEAERGTFKAFTVADSDGMTHLKALAEAGLTHIHLLPAFDIASVDEDKPTWQTVDEAALAALPPDSEAQANAVSAIAGGDGFNWGYDPYHYTAPEGSYATDPDGPARIREFREMVQALNAIGLRVVMDVVYNHTSASGQNEKSVLDKIVPGYYHRLNGEGGVETSTCCQNTATEHAMMEKLMIDSVVTWATAYKVDGFRFDLMGHHMLSNMVNVRSALDALTPERDGVNGSQVYIYGEGWNFGEVADNRRGVNATQLNIGGAGIGVFNDRLRDGARGGNPFGDPREQGFLTGLFLQPNAAEARDLDAQKAKLLDYTDWIRLGLAGNLRDYELVRADGSVVNGGRVLYNGSAAGYTLDPQENIVYVSAHDNETLFDAVQLKAAASATLADRVRMHNLGLSVVLLSQGVPFFHAGDDLLRSKSLDRNSYNSGDWFNKIDWTGQTNNWGVGLPIEGRDRWPIMSPLLGDPALKPSPADIQFAAAHFREMLQIRKSSPLFRLRTAEQIQHALTFLNTGPEQIPGLIVMHLSDAAGGLDPNYDQIVVLFNANEAAITFADGRFEGLAYELHPIQKNSVDPALRTAAFDPASGAFTIPARTAAVFVVPQAAPEPTATVEPAATTTPAPSPTFVPQATPAPAETPAPSLGWLGGLAVAILVLLGGLWFWMRRKK
jgi:pullulanase-type alpha-1,6-glucosidase